MSIRILILNVLAIFFTSCGHEIEFSQLNGSWIPANGIDNSGMNIIEEIIFDSNGKYSGITLSNGNSLIYEISGEYKVDKSSETINIKFTEIRKGKLELVSVPDSTYALKIIELTISTLRLETSTGIIISYKKKL